MYVRMYVCTNIVHGTLVHCTNVHYLTELRSIQEEVSAGFYPSDVYKSPKGGPKKSCVMT